MKQPLKDKTELYWQIVKQTNKLTKRKVEKTFANLGQFNNQTLWLKMLIDWGYRTVWRGTHQVPATHSGVHFAAHNEEIYFLIFFP